MLRCGRGSRRFVGAVERLEFERWRALSCWADGGRRGDRRSEGQLCWWWRKRRKMSSCCCRRTWTLERGSRPGRRGDRTCSSHCQFDNTGDTDRSGSGCADGAESAATAVQQLMPCCTCLHSILVASDLLLLLPVRQRQAHHQLPLPPLLLNPWRRLEQLQRRPETSFSFEKGGWVKDYVFLQKKCSHG